MKAPHSALIIRLIPILGFVLLLSSCAPTTGLAPSGALKEQLQAIKQQQQEQATQLQQLQQQVGLLQQQLTAENLVTTQIQENIESPQQSEPTPSMTTVPTFPNQEAVNIAASASSYLAAFSNLASGNFGAAETGFQEFLRDFPDHQYSPNARYWLAKAQLSQGKNSLAVENLQQIITDQNAQKKAPAALMQLAQIYQKQGLQIQADNVLEQLRNRYPESPEAQHFYQSTKLIN